MLVIQKCNSKQQRKNTINRARRGTRHEETNKTEKKSEKEMKKCRSQLLMKEERRTEQRKSENRKEPSLQLKKTHFQNRQYLWWPDVL